MDSCKADEARRLCRAHPTLSNRCFYISSSRSCYFSLLRMGSTFLMNMTVYFSEISVDDHDVCLNLFICLGIINPKHRTELTETEIEKFRP